MVRPDRSRSVGCGRPHHGRQLRGLAPAGHCWLRLVVGGHRLDAVAWVLGLAVGRPWPPGCARSRPLAGRGWLLPSFGWLWLALVGWCLATAGLAMLRQMMVWFRGLTLAGHCWLRPIVGFLLVGYGPHGCWGLAVGRSRPPVRARTGHWLAAVGCGLAMAGRCLL